jgi:acyl carrier protein phosphodiesterase
MMIIAEVSADTFCHQLDRVVLLALDVDDPDMATGSPVGQFPLRLIQSILHLFRRITAFDEPFPELVNRARDQEYDARFRIVGSNRARAIEIDIEEWYFFLLKDFFE